MLARLKRGDNINLCEEQSDLSEITIGLGWDIAAMPGEIPALHQLGAAKPHEEHDLDAVAILLGANGKIMALGSNGGASPSDSSDVVFHKTPRHLSGAIWLTGDNRTGEGEGDDEQIIVRLHELDAKYHRILFLAIIHDGKHRKQHFGNVKNAYIRAVNDKHQEICRYNISGDPTLINYTAITFAEVVRNGAEWRFRALGIPHESDRFVDLLKPYL